MGIMGIYVRTSIETEGTSIQQQTNEGKEFCKKHGFECLVYEDEGKSGFKIDDNDNPFINRPGMTKLINDIKKKLVDKIWVYETSRLSRNQISFSKLVGTLREHNVTIYVKTQQFDMNNPSNKMIQGILAEVAEYERHMIVDRTKRGLYDALALGFRGYNECYGYRKAGREESKGKKSGHVIWAPVESEIENIKYVYRKFFQGQSLNSILSELYKKENISEREMVALTKKWPRILKRFENTGFSLNAEGLAIYNQFKNGEIDNIRELDDPKYYIKSVSYPRSIITIAEWMMIVEKFQKDKLIYREKMRKTDTEMMTGVIECPYCEQKFYIHVSGKYSYYKHMVKRPCGQIPKSLNVEKINELFKTFYFFYPVFSDHKELIKESQNINKLNQLDIKEKIDALEKQNKSYDKQIDRFQSIYEESDDDEMVKLTLLKETELTKKKESNHNALLLYKTELEELRKKYEQEELELTHQDVKGDITNFFETASAEEQRTSLLKIIKRCQIFGVFIVINTGRVLFVFNSEDNNILTDEAYQNFKDDIHYKGNFTKTPFYFDKDGNPSRKGKEIAKKTRIGSLLIGLIHTWLGFWVVKRFRNII